MKKSFSIILFAVSFAVAFAIGSAVTVIPNYRSTSTMRRIRTLERRLRMYCDANGKLPSSIGSVKAPDEDEKHVLINAWGGPIEYSVTNGTVATLSTYRLCGPEPKILHEFVLKFDAAMQPLRPRRSETIKNERGL